MKKKSPLSPKSPIPPILPIPPNPGLTRCENLAANLVERVEKWFADADAGKEPKPEVLKYIREGMFSLSIAHRIHLQNDRRNHPELYRPAPKPPRDPKDSRHDKNNQLPDRIEASNRISRAIQLLRPAPRIHPETNPAPKEPV